ncbi:MAG: metallopeptidase family protein [Alphaproteobacteria bacterium]|nr:metallopeptidase family protein [Alphaproteobacteria bacterium]
MSNQPVARHMDPPSLTDIEELAQHALSTIPDALSQYVRGVVLQVVDFPDRETMAEMRLETPFDLLGLYRGVSLDRKSVSHVATDVDMIYLYRRPLLDYWAESGQPLWRIVRHVVIHECGHHFGFSDEDMDRIEGEP